MKTHITRQARRDAQALRAAPRSEVGSDSFAARCWRSLGQAEAKWLLVAMSAACVLLGLALASPAHAQDVGAVADGLQISVGGQDAGASGVMKLTVILTLMSLAPALLMTMTSFTRIIIVFSFLRLAMGTQQTPPNQVLIGLSLFLTLFIMTPTLTQVEEQAYRPYVEGKISTTEAMEAGSVPLRSFMLRQTREKDLGLFFKIADRDKPSTVEEVPMTIVIPAFIISELRTAFEIGFLIYIPFLVVDMLVASILMSMGMMMLPPVVISLPFKLLLFVMIDGWHLIIGTLVQSFY